MASTPTTLNSPPAASSAGARAIQQPFAQSQADVFAESGGATDEGTATPLSGDFSKALSDAQRADKGTTPAPTPAKPAAPPADPATPPPKPTLPKLPDKPTKAADWEALKTRHAEEVARLSAERDTYQRDLAAAKAVGDTEEVKRLREEHKQYKEILRDVAIERDPEFKARYSVREKAAIDAATQAAGDSGEKLAKLLTLPSTPWRDEQITKLTEDLSASSKRRVEAALTLLEQVDVERGAEIASRRATFDTTQSALMTEQKQREAAQRQQLDGVFSKVQAEWADKHPFFAQREGDQEHNAAVTQTLALAKEIFNGQMSPDDLAAAAFWAASGARVLDGWMKEKTAREAAEAQLDRLRGVQPSGDRAGSAGTPEKQAEYSGNVSTDMRSFSRGLAEAKGRDSQAVGAKR